MTQEPSSSPSSSSSQSSPDAGDDFVPGTMMTMGQVAMLKKIVVGLGVLMLVAFVAVVVTIIYQASNLMKKEDVTSSQSAQSEKNVESAGAVRNRQGAARQQTDPQNVRKLVQGLVPLPQGAEINRIDLDGSQLAVYVARRSAGEGGAEQIGEIIVIDLQNGQVTSRVKFISKP